MAAPRPRTWTCRCSPGGLLGRVVTRICFPDEADANAADPVLCSIADPEARVRLVAVAEGDGLRFNIHLQGDQETPFLAI
jgi:protocatechuate 3,4-dioxygenase, alpha subunit